MPTPPKIDALLMCEHVHPDSSSGQFTLVGIWRAARPDVFPTPPTDLGLYASLTGLNGEYRLRAVLLAPHLVEEIVAVEFDPILSDDPLARHEVGAQLLGVAFPVPGRYTVRLLYNDRIATEVTLPLEPEDDRR